MQHCIAGFCCWYRCYWSKRKSFSWRVSCHLWWKETGEASANDAFSFWFFKFDVEALNVWYFCSHNCLLLLTNSSSWCSVYHLHVVLLFQVLITDLTKDWPAQKSWNLSQLVENYGEVAFKVSQSHGKKIKMKLKDYASYMACQHDEEPLYIFDAKVFIRSTQSFSETLLLVGFLHCFNIRTMSLLHSWQFYLYPVHLPLEEEEA